MHIGLTDLPIFVRKFLERKKNFTIKALPSTPVHDMNKLNSEYMA